MQYEKALLSVANEVPTEFTSLVNLKFYLVKGAGRAEPTQNETKN
jgi:hypothetical protein